MFSSKKQELGNCEGEKRIFFANEYFGGRLNVFVLWKLCSSFFFFFFDMHRLFKLASMGNLSFDQLDFE